MTFINSYKPPQTSKAPTPRKSFLSTLEDISYDINFAFTLPTTLETSRVKLIPFIPSQHAERFFESTKGHDLFRLIPFSCTTWEEFLGFVELLRGDSSCVLLLVIDKTKVDPTDHNLGGSMAGMIGLVHHSKQNLSTEIGPVLILPPFQRTHVCTNAVGIMMRYCLELPSAGGLGFRRVQWTANLMNLASVKVAERMGFVREGTLRWSWVLPEGKEGKKSREGDPVSGLGRDSVLLAVCWDDWEGGVREHVDKLIEKV
jgi:RimJ/RimL family protein N-acetyltransferase